MVCYPNNAEQDGKTWKAKWILGLYTVVYGVQGLGLGIYHLKKRESNEKEHRKYFDAGSIPSGL